VTTSHIDASLTGSAVGRLTRTNASTGRIYFWQGGSLWIGQGRGRTEWHEHHAHQITVAPAGTFRFRTEQEDKWESYEGALVPSHCTHQFEIDGVAMAHLFVEPESRAGRALTERFGASAVSQLSAGDGRAAARALFEAFRSTPAHERMVAAAAEAVAALCGATTEPDHALDPRLARALEYVRMNVRNSIALRDVAAAVALSESRFRHLFVAATGSSFRAYLLWLRINLAIEAVMGGASWTEAAHEAGFADSAHLTRTHKRVFGIEPSAIKPQALRHPSA
jgi:AraC family transcriptional regulator